MKRRETPWTEDAIPDSVELHLQEAAALKLAAQPRWHEYIEAVAVPLGELRRRVEGGAVSVRDEFGTQHQLDLRKLQDRPDATPIVASFSYQQRSAPAGLRATVYPDDLLDRVVAYIDPSARN